MTHQVHVKKSIEKVLKGDVDGYFYNNVMEHAEVYDEKEKVITNYICYKRILVPMCFLGELFPKFILVCLGSLSCIHQPNLAMAI